MRISLAGLALAAGLGLSACGAGGSTSSSGAAATVTHTATVTNSTATSPAATGSSASTATGGAAISSASSTAAGAPPCRASGLALSFLGQQGATGHGELGFALRNTGTAGCGTVGYPGVQFLDRAGAALPTTPAHTTTDFFGHAPEQSLTLAPGQTASFRLGVTHGAGSSAGCTTAYGLQVIPPNDTANLRVQIPGGAFECISASVSPMRPGDSAYP
jgi:hypothetical protein